MLTLYKKKRLLLVGGSRSSLAKSDIKQKVDARGVSLESCEAKYSDTNRALISSQICAGGKEMRDTCIMDG